MRRRVFLYASNSYNNRHPLQKRPLHTMAVVFNTCKLNTTTTTALKYFAPCSSAFHSSSSKTSNISSISFLNAQNIRFSKQSFCSHYYRAYFSRGLGESLSARRTLFTCASLADREKMEQQFEEFRQQLEESGSVRERLRGVVADLESVTRLMQANLLQVHYAAHSQEILEKAKVHIGKLKELYAQLAEVIKGCPGQYYRYHDHWRNQTYNVVFLIVFLHWLETGNLLSYVEMQNLLGLNSEEFGIDIEDYLIGLCNMSNELPRYVVNQVTMGDYECPGRVSRFLSDLYAAFRILNLRNDLLRKRFDGMKYDLRKVEEVLYDVKIRRLDSLETSIETKPSTS